ncbi:MULTISPECIES: c-type cytochrome [Pseudovibrio]|uniref:c-type cytochrome n=1 Tax=Stappiaceae TaxID=2821832 RepID=UPI0023651C25|nr:MULTISPECIES: cytochrome c family protein [Pseudovibrio]MDD7909696.1 cytochrome c family protein [Pseudovibrio exalbescens]MDX5592038.1 cytochrome c family protein [Pseudovibrio sp. SPO723]
MDSFELNKIAGAILFALVAIMGFGVLSDIIFASHEPEVRGYQIAVATSEGDGVAAAAPEVEPIEVRLASASVDDGAKQFRKCAACHTVEQGGANKVGPALWGVVGRAPATHEGFSYSSAMQEYAQTHDAWTFEQLDHFIEKPKDHVPGTSMGFAGLRKPQDRAALIAYLNSLSDNPVPVQ